MRLPALTLSIVLVASAASASPIEINVLSQEYTASIAGKPHRLGPNRNDFHADASGAHNHEHRGGKRSPGLSKHGPRGGCGRSIQRLY